MQLTPTPDTRYHPADRCALCDAERKSEPMSVALIETTGALGWRCDDICACVRRLSEKRRAA